MRAWDQARWRAWCSRHVSPQRGQPEHVVQAQSSGSAGLKGLVSSEEIQMGLNGRAFAPDGVARQ